MAVWIVLLIISAELTCSSSSNQKNNPRQGWSKFSVVVLDSSNTFIPSPSLGSFLLKDNAVVNSKRTLTIGRCSQRCLVVPGLNNGAANSADCIWVFNLKLSNSQPGQIMLQGSFFRTPNIAPPADPNLPPTQFIGITGGTGIFTGAYGVARIIPLDLTAQPPIWGYTFYIKVPRNSPQVNFDNNNNNNNGYNW